MKKLTSGVYFLYKGNELVYIGESENIFSRIGTHIKENIKDFDNWSYYEIDGTRERKALEGFLISIHKPKYNEAGLKNEHIRVHCGGNDLKGNIRKQIFAFEEFQCWVDLDWMKTIFEIDDIEIELLVYRKIIPETVVRTNENKRIVGFRRSWIMDNFARISMGIVQIKNDEKDNKRSLFE